MIAPVFRPAGPSDIEAFMRFAGESGGGMTNLPDDRETLLARLARSEASFGADVSKPIDELYIFMLEVDGEPAGTAQLFSRVGEPFGFVNFKITTLVHASPALKKRALCDILVLNHDFTGASEVGGLFLDAGRRGSGVGRFLARARYLFIAQSPERFGDEVVAELRGWQEPDGRQPFWDAVGRRFFDMEFREADLMNAKHGNRFIADLMPQHPVYAAMLPEEARACIGRPHQTGEAALRMLLEEGFRYRRYVDIFDAGPLVSAEKGDIRAIADSALVEARPVDRVETPERRVVAAGAGADFRAAFCRARTEDGGVYLSGDDLRTLNVASGDVVRVL